MKIEDAKKILAQVKSFEEMQAALERKQDFLNGLMILAKYDDNIQPAFEHDICYVSYFEKTVLMMSEHEVNLMRTYGWFEREESWACYA